MLTDREAEEIERGRRAGVGGPLILKWIDLLLADRKERIRRVEHLRCRLGQAFRYLDGLVRDIEGPTLGASKTGSRPLCPKCGKQYDRATGLSPGGIVFFHADRNECRHDSSTT